MGAMGTFPTDDMELTRLLGHLFEISEAVS
jgi:hypothetical protein